MLTDSKRWAHASPGFIFSACLYAWGGIMFGIDTGTFGSLQTLPSWLNTFGSVQPNGTLGLSNQRKSIMNSVPWIGKILGTVLFEPILEKIGYRYSLYVVCVVQATGIIMELAATEWILFSSGRVISYLAVGLVENLVPSYTSEISPAPLRGFFAGSLCLLTAIGNMWGAGMSRGYATEEGKVGWMVPVAIALVPVAILGLGLPFAPESPRWLVSKGRREEAIRAMAKVRNKEARAAGTHIAEIDTLEAAIAQSKIQGTGRWVDAFRGNYFRRTMICIWLFVFQQSTGSQFINTFLPSFLKNLSLGAKAYTYNTLAQGLGAVAILIAMYCFDRFGRRPVLITGCSVGVIAMLIVAGLGAKGQPTKSEINGVVAAIMFFVISVKIGLNSGSYLVGSELGGTRMRKKIMAIGTFWDVIAAFVQTYAVPYMLWLNSKVGWIYAGIGFAALLFVVFFVPELKGRSLEEVDELFEAKLWAWRFSKYETHGAGHHIAELEANHVGDASEDDEKAKAIEREARV